MNYKKFNNYLDVVLNALNAQESHHDEKTAKIFADQGKWALHRLEEIFKDRDHNIWSWLNNEPCIYKSDVTGNEVRIQVGPDREAFYYFLIFCKRINEKLEICEDFRDFLMHLLKQSSSKNWEEC